MEFWDPEQPQGGGGQTPEMLGQSKRLIYKKEKKKEKGITGLFNSPVLVTMDTVFINQVRFSWCHVYNTS